MADYEITYMNPNGRNEPLSTPIDDIDKDDKNETWMCYNCGNMVSCGTKYCPECTSRKGKRGIHEVDDEGIETFAQYYDKWKDETKFLSVGEFENANFKAICNPEIVPIWETIIGCYRLLEFHDDKVVYALEQVLDKFVGKPIIQFDGYVNLHDYCTAWRKALFFIVNDYVDIENEALNGVKNY